MTIINIDPEATFNTESQEAEAIITGFNTMMREQICPAISNIIARNFYESTRPPAISKDDGTPLTPADIMIEEHIIALIKAKHPTHKIIGEETGTTIPTEYQDLPKTEQYCWVIDPIDGTSALLCGKATYTTLIALIHNGAIIASIIYQPVTRELYLCSKEIATYIPPIQPHIPGKATPPTSLPHTLKLNKQFLGKETRNNTINLQKATIASTSPSFYTAQNQQKLENLTNNNQYSTYNGVFWGGDAYNFAKLAQGIVHIALDPGMKIYDFAAIIPLVEAAGGVITDWEGNSLRPIFEDMDKLDTQKTYDIIATNNPKLHAEAIKSLQNQQNAGQINEGQTN